MAVTVSAASRALVEASIGAVAAKGPHLTQAFYKRMFDRHPDMLDTFNITHQHKGEQPKALFGAIVMGAKSVLSEGKVPIPTTVLKCITHKHCSLDIQPDSYNIVGENLLAAVKEELKVGDDILGAWGEMYGVIANALIQTEAAMYADSLANGGWAGKRDLVVVRKRALSPLVCEVGFRLADGGALPKWKAGQYMSLWPSAQQLKGSQATSVATVGVHAQPRQYSITSVSGRDDMITFAVRYVEGGVVSPWLHGLKEGDTVPATAPFGPLEVPQSDKIVMISTGAGISSNIGILRQLLWHSLGSSAEETAARKGYAQRVLWVMGAKNGLEHPFRAEMMELENGHPNLSRAVFYTDPTEEDLIGSHYHHTGTPSHESLVAEGFGEHLDGAEFLLSGSGRALHPLYASLMAGGVPKDKVHIELFGSGLNMLDDAM
eukprot:TRINITY_DN33697_c0_g1_i1.p1 TRINITY_DN33697_c0_g1~~TRINITY_DN33697_c0_g1_i1.p1  ORF type:complete len:433 (+),score=123.61 TRINITY_DN33697_c0_g1_i1:51-1349(+)